MSAPAKTDSAQKRVIPDDPRWGIGDESLKDVSPSNNYFQGDEVKMFTQNSITLLAAHEKVGKTMMALSYGVELAQCGYRVLYICAEGIDTVKKRVRALLSNNPAPLTWALCNNSTQARAVAEDLLNVSNNFELVIIDTLRSVYTGRDDQNAAAMRPVIDSWESARENKTALLVLHHRPKRQVNGADLPYIGSVAIGAGVDSIWTMSVDKDTKRLRLRSWRQREGSDPPDKLAVIENTQYGAPIWRWLDITYWRPTRETMQRAIDALLQFPNGISSNDFASQLLQMYPDEDWAPENIHYVVTRLIKESTFDVVNFDGEKRIIIGKNWLGRNN